MRGFDRMWLRECAPGRCGAAQAPVTEHFAARQMLMPLDPYQQCPCGLDKKVKFCCGSDIVSDLEKIEDAIASEQRMQALDQINHLLETKQDRPCLYMYKAMVHIGLREFDAARQDVERLLDLSAENPSGLALDAMLDCFDDSPRDAVPVLQHALEVQQGKLNQTVYECIGAVGRALASAGELIAARGHLLFQVAASQSRDEQALSALLELDGSGQIPLVAQGMSDLARIESSSPTSAAHVAQFNEALRMAQLGCWQLGAKMFTDLAQQEPNESAIWKNIGVLLSFIAENDAASYAFRRFSELESVPRDEAIEAEAMAQFMLPPTETDMVEQVMSVFTINDAAGLTERLLSNKRLMRMSFDPEEFRSEDEVPPQGVFLLLDREMPTGLDADALARLTPDDLPSALGDVMLFGKQTDREARVEFSTTRKADYAAKRQQVRDLLGSHLVAEQGEEVVGHLSASAEVLMPQWRFPSGAPLEVRRRLVDGFRDQALIHDWTNLPQDVLDGKTAREGAADPALQVRVLAAILLLDLSAPQEMPIYNELRRSLGLPEATPIDPTGLRVTTLSPARLARLEVEKLSDLDLLTVYRRAILYSSARILGRVGPEVVARPGLDEEVDKAEVYEVLARMSSGADEALEMIQRAQEAAKAKGKSPARYMLAELPIRLQRREEQEVLRLIETLRTRHSNEPGIAQGLYSILTQLGLVPGGGPGASRGPAAGPMSPAPAAAPGPASALWTPDQPAAAAPAEKSKLWIPGMD
jgi:tetratricopeptide (TPR) repeat protein